MTKRYYSLDPISMVFVRKLKNNQNFHQEVVWPLSYLCNAIIKASLREHFKIPAVGNVYATAPRRCRHFVLLAFLSGDPLD